MGRDPLEEDGGVNLFSSVRNDPLNQIDSIGLMGCIRRPSLDSVSCEDMEKALRSFRTARAVPDGTLRSDNYDNLDDLRKQLREKPVCCVGGLGSGTTAEGKKLPQGVQEVIEYYECNRVFNTNPDRTRHPSNLRFGGSKNPVHAQQWGEAELQRMDSVILDLEAKISARKCCPVKEQ